jgi:hypothetical protein
MQLGCMMCLAYFGKVKMYSICAWNNLAANPLKVLQSVAVRYPLAPYSFVLFAARQLIFKHSFRLKSKYFYDQYDIRLID